jgi:uncharacterized protein (TIGR03083 family)
MLQEAVDLRAEGDEFHALLSTLDTATWWRPTPFKDWSAFDVIAHLHVSDQAARLAISDPEDSCVGWPRGKGRLCRETRSKTREPQALLAQWHGCLNELSGLAGAHRARHPHRLGGPSRWQRERLPPRG